MAANRYGLGNRDYEVNPVVSRCLGTAFSVFNLNTKTAQNDPDDPASIAAGDHAHDVNVPVVVNENLLPWLDLFPLISGSTLPVTAVEVRAYGFFPYRTDMGQMTKYFSPGEANSTSFDNSVLDEGSVAGMWFPLKLLNAAAPGIVTFDNTAVMNKDSTAGSKKQQQLLTPRSVYTAGAPKILVSIVTAHDAGITAGLLLGRFTN